MEMWAQDAAAMYGYAASSAVATELAPYQPTRRTPPPRTRRPTRPLRLPRPPPSRPATPRRPWRSDDPAADPAARCRRRCSSSSAATITTWPFSMLQTPIQDFLDYGLPTPTNNWIGTVRPPRNTPSIHRGGSPCRRISGWASETSVGASDSRRSTVPVEQRPVRVVPGSRRRSSPAALGAVGGGLGGAHTGGAVVGDAWRRPARSAGCRCRRVGPTPTGARQPAVTQAGQRPTCRHAGAAPNAAGTNAVLRGMPMAGARGRRNAPATGCTNKYGFRYSVLTRPPSAG